MWRLTETVTFLTTFINSSKKNIQRQTLNGFEKKIKCYIIIYI